MRLASVTFMVLEAYLFAFLVLKAYFFLMHVPELPGSILALALNSVSFYIHLKLLLRRLWAWQIVLTLNLLGLVLAGLLLASGNTLFQWGVVLESGLMFILLYLNRHIYIRSLSPPCYTISTPRTVLKLSHRDFNLSRVPGSDGVSYPLHNGSQPDIEETST